VRANVGKKGAAMAKRVAKSSQKNGVKLPAAGARGNGNGKQGPAPDAAPGTVELRAQVTGEVIIRLRLVDPSCTAKKLADLLNRGNAVWDVGDPARYHRIAKGGRVLAEIEDADEYIDWEQYRVE
jgi:hypothetical protein